MAKYSTSSAAVRKAQNKGVAHGTVRAGKGGRTQRRYNAGTGRWDVIKNTRASSAGSRSKLKGGSSAGYSAGRVVGSGTDKVNAATSSGSARTSMGVARGGKTAATRSAEFRATRDRVVRGQTRQAAVRGYTQIISGNPIGGLYTWSASKPSKDLRKRVNKSVLSAQKSIARWWQGY